MPRPRSHSTRILVTRADVPAALEALKHLR